MQFVDVIARKRDGEALPREAIDQFVEGVVGGQIPDYQASALLMAIVLRGMTDDETAWLTDAMLRSGDRVDLSDLPGIKVGKHSTGGVGDKVSIVLAPVAASADGGSYNVNADTFAGAIAGALKAKRFLLLTDVPGVLDRSNKLIDQMSAADVRRLIADGTISGGMIPKVETCLYALDQGVEGVVILDGKVPHAVLLELFTDLGAGTLIHR